MTNLKECSRCGKRKDAERDFYLCSGKFRSECKKCTIKSNVRYQKRVQAWKTRFPDDEARKKYMREYYANNKDKFTKYRRDFKANHPGYYKIYWQKIVAKKRVRPQ